MVHLSLSSFPHGVSVSLLPYLLPAVVESWSVKTTLPLSECVCDQLEFLLCWYLSWRVGCFALKSVLFFSQKSEEEAVDAGVSAIKWNLREPVWLLPVAAKFLIPPLSEEFLPFPSSLIQKIQSSINQNPSQLIGCRRIVPPPCRKWWRGT